MASLVALFSLQCTSTVGQSQDNAVQVRVVEEVPAERACNNETCCALLQGQRRSIVKTGNTVVCSACRKHRRCSKGLRMLF